MQVARTILQQLGGNRFIAMTGAKDFVRSDNSLQFAIGRNSSRANKVRIVLDPSDTYTVEFYRYSRKTFDAELLKKVDGVYCDMLQDVFTNYTGLDTHL